MTWPRSHSQRDPRQHPTPRHGTASSTVSSKARQGQGPPAAFSSSEFTGVPAAYTPNIHGISLQIVFIAPILEMKMRHREVIELDRRSKARIPGETSWLQDPGAKPLLCCCSLHSSWPSSLAHPGL